MGEFSVIRGVSSDGSVMEWQRLKTLGCGSYGVVQLVKPTKPGVGVGNHQLYALKTCLHEDSSSLEKEFQVLARLRGCPNVVQCCGEMFSFRRDEAETTRVYNLVLEYAAGGTLFDLMKKYGGRIPEADAAIYARMLVQGLADIHQRGFVHCDLKPANILVCPATASAAADSTLKIADFGLTRLQGEVIDVRMVEPWWPQFPGTSVYMPPEGIDAEQVHASLDIWSLGCTVLQMVTGKLPWEYLHSIDVASKLSTWGNSPEIPENMSWEGKDFLSRCFARNPSERWTAEMLLCHPFLLPPQSLSIPSPTLQQQDHHHHHHHQQAQPLHGNPFSFVKPLLFV